MAKKRIFAGLDIGGNGVKMIIIQQAGENDNFQIIAHCQESCSGLRRGVVINIQEVSEAIMSCVKQSEGQLSRKIRSVSVNINGSHIFLTASHGLVSVSRADRKISQEDINRVMHAAEVFQLPLNKEVLDIFPKEFIVDGEKGIKEAVGLLKS